MSIGRKADSAKKTWLAPKPAIAKWNIFYFATGFGGPRRFIEAHRRLLGSTPPAGLDAHDKYVDPAGRREEAARSPLDDGRIQPRLRQGRIAVLLALRKAPGVSPVFRRKTYPRYSW